MGNIRTTIYLSLRACRYIQSMKSFWMCNLSFLSLNGTRGGGMRREERIMDSRRFAFISFLVCLSASLV